MEVLKGIDLHAYEIFVLIPKVGVDINLGFATITAETRGLTKAWLGAVIVLFFSGFPAWRQSGDALYYASYFADKTFNPFVSYPIIAVYFVSFTLLIIALFGWANKRLNRHIAPEQKNQVPVQTAVHPLKRYFRGKHHFSPSNGMAQHQFLRMKL